ncbi:MAG: CoA transferase [Deltaproteobacteria bacterium]|nr:CoA transferase [Deltaproteobacteria bacterium]
MKEKKPGQALSHIRVLDLTEEKGQQCGKFLADLGADVIKVEPPGGDPIRLKGPFFNDISDRETSLSWLGANTGKKSITLNLESREGRGVFLRLVRNVNIVIESYPPGYMKSIGLDYSNLEAENPSIVLTSISPFGQEGPYAEYKAYDLTITAMSGFMFTCGEADRAPVRISVGQAYAAAGAQAASASLLALSSCVLNGKGQHVDVSMRDCLPSGGFEIYFFDTEGYIGERLGGRRRRANIFIRDLWPCKDGYIGWRLMVGMLGAPTAYKLIDWMDEEGMAGELKTVKWETLDMTEITQKDMERWEGLIIPFLKKHTKAEIYEKAVQHEMLMAPAYNIKELMDYSQLIERGYWNQIYYEDLDASITHPGAFCRMSGSPIRPARRAPLMGENNKEIYVDELEISEREMELYKSRGII